MKVNKNMVILDKALEVPATPDPTWGVELRKRSLKDFAVTLKTAFFTAFFAAGAFIPAIAQFEILPEKSIGEPMMGMFIAFAIANLIIFGCAMGRRNEEANDLSDAKAAEWVKSTLKPYIEQKYGVKFYRGEPVFGWNWPSVEFEGRTIQIRIHGVSEDRNYRFSSDIGHKTYKVDPEGIWIEEIIKPESVSYKRMTPIEPPVYVS
jgi:hypothetical protein